jgi:hypothetical protein
MDKYGYCKRYLSNGTEGYIVHNVPEYDVPHPLQPVLVLAQEAVLCFLILLKDKG